MDVAGTFASPKSFFAPMNVGQTGFLAGAMPGMGSTLMSTCRTFDDGVSASGGAFTAEGDAETDPVVVSAGDAAASSDGGVGPSGSSAGATVSVRLSAWGCGTKSGSGALTLSGHNSYGGGTIVRDGTLVASAADALGTGGVLVSGGALSLAAEKDVVIGGDYAQSGGTLALDPQKAALRIKGNAVLDGATLRLAFDGDAPAAGTRLAVLSANGLTGTFATIDAGNLKVRPVYTGSAMSVVVE